MKSPGWIAVAALCFAISPCIAQADTFGVSVDTSSLIGNSAGPYELGFLLIDASGTGDGNNTVAISNFAFGGGSPGPVDPSGTIGGASGNLTSTVTLTDNSFFNALSASFTPGSTLSFSVNMTTNPDSTIDPSTGLTGDQFDFLIFNSANQAIATTDPTGGNTFANATVGPSGLTVQEFAIPTATTPVPEPSTVFLLGFGLVLLIAFSRRRLSVKPL